MGGYSGFAPYWKDLNFCLAEIQGILVGVLGYTIANIDRIVVHSDYRRLGIGTELISRATTHLATMGHTTVEVQTVTPE
ncbi:MAG TPA: GNAT family N-acetyltransferase [bacterium]|nr:GNAT family N-acetyltransferase [bacterium]